MAYTAASLADGQLAAAEADIYTSTGVKTLLATLEFSNVGTALETVNIFVKRSGGTSRQIFRFQLAPNEGATIDRVRALSSGDKLRAYATNAAAVNYQISGATE